MPFWLITIIIDVFSLYTFYHSVQTGMLFLPQTIIPYLGPIFIILIFLIFYLSFLSLFLQPNLSPVQKIISCWWGRVILIISCLVLTFFNFIYTIIFLGLGQENVGTPAWGETIFLIAILSSVFFMLAIWFSFMSAAGDKGHRQKHLNFICRHPFLSSLTFGLSAIIFPVITATFYLIFFTELPIVNKQKIISQSLTKPITNVAHLLFGGFVLILFYLELGIAQGADEIFSYGSHLVYTVIMTLICFYLPIQGFLSLADKTVSSRSRWLLLVEATIIFGTQIAILYKFS